MPLTCSCDYDGWEYDAGSWYFEYLIKDLDFEPFNELRRKRCISCNELIDFQSPCVRFYRVRYPYTDVEAKFAGYFDLEDALGDTATIKGTDLFQCEKCGEIYLNLESLGFECLAPAEDMRATLKEYQALHRSELAHKKAKLLKHRPAKKYGAKHSREPRDFFKLFEALRKT